MKTISNDSLNKAIYKIKHGQSCTTGVFQINISHADVEKAGMMALKKYFDKINF